MNADQRRDFVRCMYRSSKWKRRVDRMSDGQILAIWTREIAKQEALLAEARSAKAESNQLDF